jgi:uncharacterized protein involved in response to NO
MVKEIAGVRAPCCDRQIGGVSVMLGVARTRHRAGAGILFAHGFRPFFLLAGLYGALAVPLWLGLYTGWLGLQPALAPLLWHGHEMLFGFATAVLAGFLLTATPAWSGLPPVAGAPLAGLVLVWLAGRAAICFGGGLPAAAVIVDLAFLPALALAIAPHLQAAARRNLVFLPLLGGLLLANLAVDLDGTGLLPGIATMALRAALDLFVLIIALIGGRIVPSFTANALKTRGEAVALRSFSWLDRLALGALIAMLLADLATLPRATGALALVAALLNALRMWGWRARRTLGEPLLWVLHLGYAWLAVGLAWKGLVDLTGFLPGSEALHGLAIGAIGTMTIGVMSRASLGHTGRPLVAPRPAGLAYLLISGAALARLAAPLLAADLYLAALLISASLWSAAWLLFLAAFAGVLIRPRIDGQPG